MGVPGGGGGHRKLAMLQALLGQAGVFTLYTTHYPSIPPLPPNTDPRRKERTGPFHRWEQRSGRSYHKASQDPPTAAKTSCKATCRQGLACLCLVPRSEKVQGRGAPEGTTRPGAPRLGAPGRAVGPTWAGCTAPSPLLTPSPPTPRRTQSRLGPAAGRGVSRYPAWARSFLSGPHGQSPAALPTAPRKDQWELLARHTPQCKGP